MDRLERGDLRVDGQDDDLGPLERGQRAVVEGRARVDDHRVVGEQRGLEDALARASVSRGLASSGEPGAARTSSPDEWWAAYVRSSSGSRWD